MRNKFIQVAALAIVALVFASSSAAATLTVTSSADSGAGSLRDTVAGAAAGDNIQFDSTVTSITLSTAISIGIDIEIVGPGTASLTLSGGNATRLFDVTAGTVVLSGMTMTNGSAVNGAAVNVTGGTLTLEFCDINNCNTSSSSFDGGAVRNSGGILNIFDTSITNCTNTDSGGGGGGIWLTAGGPATIERVQVTNCGGSRASAIGIVGSHGAMTLRYSTIANNTSTNTRASVYGQSGNGHIVENCTITNNVAASNWGGFFPISGTWTIRNNTITGNSQMDINVQTSATISNNLIGVAALWSGSVTSNGYNIVSDAGTTTGWVGTDSTGTTGTPINLMLGTLANNGGPTDTMLPQTGSPAINFVVGSGTDLGQRGLIRTGTIDAGAVEIGGSGPYSVSPSSVLPGGVITLTGEEMTQITAVTIGGIAGTLGAATSTTLVVTLGASTPAGAEQTIEVTAAAKTQNWLSIDVIGVPEIDLQRPVSTSIADGGTDTVATPGVAAVAMSTLTYTIANTGGLILNLTGAGSLVAQSNAVNCSAVIVDPAGATVAIGATTTFTVVITPAAAGAWSVDISIDNDDANENPYNFTISGTATATPEPEIDLTDGGSAAIASGATVTEFGSIAAIANTTVTYTITNNGNADLTISAAATGTDVNGTSGITLPTPATVTATSTTTFDVDFTPTAAGAWSYVITITSNDTNEGTYTINVSGTAQAAAAPEIGVTSPTPTDLTDGGSETVLNTGTSLFTRQYTIRNEGAQALNLTGGAGSEVVISLQVNCTVTVTQPASNTLAAASGSPTTEAFVLNITPTAAGAFSFDVTIANNDLDEGPFNWSFNGNTATGTLVIGGGGGGGSGCAAGTSGSNVWFALLGLLGLVAVIRLRREVA